MDDVPAIGHTITAMLHAVDRVDWGGVRHAFADTVAVDYTSLAGGEPQSMPADQLMATWQALLPGFDATQHLLGPIVARAAGGETIAEAHVRGYHRIADAERGDLWMVAGHYTFGMVRRSDAWLIGAIKLTVFYQEGNLHLPTLAQARAQLRPRTAS